MGVWIRGGTLAVGWSRRILLALPFGLACETASG